MPANESQSPSTFDGHPFARSTGYAPFEQKPSQSRDLPGSLGSSKAGDGGASSLALVARFHVCFRQCIHDEPYVNDAEINALRVRLMQEELDELREALSAGDAVGALDALADLQYVLDGSFLSLGLHKWKDAAIAEVHRSNMSKLDANGEPIMRADGKILKSENYTRPDLEAVMAQAGARLCARADQQEHNGAQEHNVEVSHSEVATGAVKQARK